MIDKWLSKDFLQTCDQDDYLKLSIEIQIKQVRKDNL